ncbi:P2X purinoceptor 4 [Schistosoma japonicum]|uniref:P2X purinoceptor 4 n=1 Tax=Schistosoma japonicum TaxID=6182 RepID=A0A4Z2D1P3_SCHJA|nr:P2X purinoceptor 4 [Schistosoma japonicum]
MVSIHIEWNCNLDFDEEDCLPKYVFRRLDDFQSHIAKGWNFRMSQHYMDGGVRKRNLIKAYGIQFFITVYGTGGKFNILTFSMNLGSGLALLGIATVLCDMIILNTTRKRSVYRKAKIDYVAAKQRKEDEKLRNKTEEKNSYISKITNNPKLPLKHQSTNHHSDVMREVIEEQLNNKITSLLHKPTTHSMWLDSNKCKQRKINRNQLTVSKNEQFFLNQPSFLGFYCTPLSSSSSQLICNKRQSKYGNNTDNQFNDKLNSDCFISLPYGSMNNVCLIEKKTPRINDTTYAKNVQSTNNSKSIQHNDLRTMRMSTFSRKSNMKMSYTDVEHFRTIPTLPVCCTSLTKPEIHIYTSK